MDVIPKFIDYENCKKEVNRELAYKLAEKKTKLNTLINAYISEENSDFAIVINDIESDLNKHKSIRKNKKKKI